jgi:hypothetical protein
MFNTIVGAGAVGAGAIGAGAGTALRYGSGFGSATLKISHIGYPTTSCSFVHIRYKILTCLRLKNPLQIVLKIVFPFFKMF